MGRGAGAAGLGRWGGWVAGPGGGWMAGPGCVTGWVGWWAGMGLLVGTFIQSERVYVCAE